MFTTPGNVDDREHLKRGDFLDRVYGKLFADKGYFGQELFEMLFINEIKLVTCLRKKMKGLLMSLSDSNLLRKRSIIESINDVLKNTCQIEHSRHRSFGNFITNLVSGHIAYTFLSTKPRIKYEEEPNNEQLTLY